MLINEHTGGSTLLQNREMPTKPLPAISTSKTLLVPYSKHHVPQYHKWMQDPVNRPFSIFIKLSETKLDAQAIQEATASEPLTLTQEYAMQESWRNDSDKLTFIICQPLPTLTGQDPVSNVEPEVHDKPNQMIGDVNLFLSLSCDIDSQPTKFKPHPSINRSKDPDLPLDNSPPIPIQAEIELLIAAPTTRRLGHGRTALLTFMHYILRHESAIVDEFLDSLHPSSSLSKNSMPATTTKTLGSKDRASRRGKGRLELTAKIAASNTPSLALFESVGFRKKGEVNYFAEFELRFQPTLKSAPGDGDEEAQRETCDLEGVVERMMERWGVKGFREVCYGQ
jgi:Acetyltransferase (GNAT) domain